VELLSSAILVSPDLELWSVSAHIHQTSVVVLESIALTTESQDPVHKLMPSLDTPRQLTRFSWPTSEPTFSPRVISQTCQQSATSLCKR
jgi:hypothetical protein